jgi:ribosome recycling factor
MMVVGLFGCGGSDTPEAISEKWCEMTKKLKDAEGDARDALRKERKEFEKSVEEKHKDDEEFMGKIKTLTRECD